MPSSRTAGLDVCALLVVRTALSKMPRETSLTATPVPGQSQPAAFIIEEERWRWLKAKSVMQIGLGTAPVTSTTTVRIVWPHGQRIPAYSTHANGAQAAVRAAASGQGSHHVRSPLAVMGPDTHLFQTLLSVHFVLALPQSVRSAEILGLACGLGRWFVQVNLATQLTFVQSLTGPVWGEH